MTARPVGALALDYCIGCAPASEAALGRAYLERLLAERDALKAALGRARVALTFYASQMPSGITYPYGLDAEERAAKLVPDAWGAMLVVGHKPDGESQEVKP